MFKQLYQNSRAKMTVKDILSAREIRQGSSLSIILFDILIDDTVGREV